MKCDSTATGFERIVPDGASLEIIANGMAFGEGPVWNKANGYLYWVEIIGDTIWRWKQGVGKEVVMRPSYKADGMTFDQEGRLVVAGWGWRRVWRMEHDGRIVTLASEYNGLKLNTPNDIVVKSDGSIWFTDPPGAMANIEMGGEDVQRYLDFQGVFRISPEGQLDLVIDDFVYPNGLAFSCDESVLYVNDTRQNLIRAFDVLADGTLGPSRLFHKLTGNEPGVADGMKLDVEGNVYCTGPAGVHVISPNGELLGRIHIPGHTTNFGWGDDDWKGLYITTYDSVFRVRLGIPGVPVN